MWISFLLKWFCSVATYFLFVCRRVLFSVLLVLGLQCLLFFSWPVRTANAFQIASLVILFLFSPSKLKPKSLVGFVLYTLHTSPKTNMWDMKKYGSLQNVICLACCYHYSQAFLLLRGSLKESSTCYLWPSTQAKIPSVAAKIYRRLACNDKYVRQPHTWNISGIIWHHLWCDVNIYFCMFCGSVICCILVAEKSCIRMARYT